MFTTHKTTRRFGLIFKFMLEFLVDILWKRFFGGVDEEPDEVWSVTGDDGVDEEQDEVWS